jgi:hypothetical protein
LTTQGFKFPNVEPYQFFFEREGLDHG